ncbi:hypothetical protein [Methylomicrobium sp. Wu6]|uniref:hypothetical protein n=1 Tax=Methylomicrobium sp. Wu6 TaxID=3107928 RepID=UPI002DD6B036|nr:hypothetical protein [Methylomicrobium sp. Wu6]MEC4747928.1 hypothetical protein [Methylomicrobium sp. Wu6]
MDKRDRQEWVYPRHSIYLNFFQFTAFRAPVFFAVTDFPIAKTITSLLILNQFARLRQKLLEVLCSVVILNFVVAVGIAPFYRAVGGIGILQLLFSWICFVKGDQGVFHFSRGAIQSNPFERFSRKVSSYIMCISSTPSPARLPSIYKTITYEDSQHSLQKRQLVGRRASDQF